MTLTGTLTDYEGDIARINDKPLKMLPAAAKWCNDRLRKGMTIDYDLVEDGDKKGYVAKLWERKAAPSDSEDKRKAAGFGQPAGESKENCTSSGTPAGIKAVEGQIIEIDKPAHKITLKDKAGTRHTFIWGPALDADFSKLNQWWFCKVTGEHEADVDLWRATAQGFFRKPEDWPASQHGNGSGGRSFTPRNEKPIIMQVIFKEACEHSRKSEKFDPDAAWEWAVAKTEATMERLYKAGGVQ